MIHMFQECPKFERKNITTIYKLFFFLYCNKFNTKGVKNTSNEIF